jgi:hypothetical protein
MVGVMTAYISDRQCPGRHRHWRIAFGAVGMRTPVCVFCGSPNPRPLDDDEWFQLADWARDHKLGAHVTAALAEHES